MVGLIPAVRLLEEAVDYGLDCVEGVAPDVLSRPTPCVGWNLSDLLRHLDESMTALREAPEQGDVVLTTAVRETVARDTATGLVTAVRASARALLEAWRRVDTANETTVGGMPLAPGVVAFVGAIEIAVHGWDIAETCGHRQSIPARLAQEMLRWVPLVADDAARPFLFAPAMSLPPTAPAGDRLVAYLGRQPGGALPAER
jgi:uncharacterized protein (TIGR03086 family)